MAHNSDIKNVKIRGLSNTHEWSRIDFLVKTTRQAEVGSWCLRKIGNCFCEDGGPIKFVTNCHLKS